MGGFLGEIEKRNQQQIQQELTRKIDAERKLQIITQEASEKKRKEHEEYAGANDFLRDCSAITNILNQLYKFGYKDYFENVANITGYSFHKIFYTAFPEHVLNDFDMHLTNPKEKGSELTKQQLRAQERFKEASLSLGLSDTAGWFGINRELVRSSGIMFFGDNATTNTGKGLNEPKEVGMGIRFGRYVFERQKEHRNRLKELFSHESYEYLIESWNDAVYVRIDANIATITGSNQHQVNLGDLKLFDQILEQTMTNPAIAYFKRTARWDFPSGSAVDDTPKR